MKEAAVKRGQYHRQLRRLKGNQGSDPRLLRLTMDGLLDRISGERPRASRIVRALRLDLPANYASTAIYHPYGR